MAIYRKVMQLPLSEKWAYVESPNKDMSKFIILGNKEFDTKWEAVKWSGGFGFCKYLHESQSRCK